MQAGDCEPQASQPGALGYPAVLDSYIINLTWMVIKKNPENRQLAERIRGGVFLNSKVSIVLLPGSGRLPGLFVRQFPG